MDTNIYQRISDQHISTTINHLFHIDTSIFHMVLIPIIIVTITILAAICMIISSDIVTSIV